MVLTDELQYAHSHQVLHVSFSHNGRMFATCSKDGFVHVGFTIGISQLGDSKLLCSETQSISLLSDMELVVSGDNQILSRHEKIQLEIYTIFSVQPKRYSVIGVGRTFWLATFNFW